MSLVQALHEIDRYPESDGRPRAETDVHLDWMTRIRDRLTWRYRGRRVYVGSNLPACYAQARTRQRVKSVAPDHFAGS